MGGLLCKKEFSCKVLHLRILAMYEAIFVIKIAIKSLEIHILY